MMTRSKKLVAGLCCLGLLQMLPLRVASASPVASEEWVKEWVQNYVANNATTASNTTNPLWAATCTSGAPSDAFGCLGNIASKEFAALNGLLGDFLTFNNIATNQSATSDSVFIKQFSGTINPPVYNYITVGLEKVSAAYVNCGLFTSNGVSFTQAINNAPVLLRTSTYVASERFFVRYFTNTLPKDNRPLVWGRYPVKEPGTALASSFYLLCVGTTATPPYDPASLSGITAD